MIDPDEDDDGGSTPGMDAYWAECRLRTFLTDPPQHELTLPGGRILQLSTAAFFNLGRFTVAHIDATGEFPPLPTKKAAPYLVDRFRAWLATRTTVDVAEEAGERGTLLGDIRLAVMACPEADDPRDMDRGAMYVRADGKAWLNARLLLERVRRSCPVKFRPADFYRSLQQLGAVNLDVVREEGWRGRAWEVPPSMRPEPAAPPPALAAPEPEQDGFFDDLIGGDGTRPHH